MNAPSPDPAPLGALKHKRDIIDRAALQAELARLVQSDLTPDQTRSRVLATLKAALGEGQAEVRRRFEAGAKGTQTVRANCFLIDQIVRLVYDHASEHLYPLANPSKGERLALVAGASWRPIRTSTCCSCCPTRSRRAASR
jgi:[protein-PII] uridylyltransferase